LLRQAVEAFKLALQVKTRDQFSQEWAWTQYNLGLALRDQGIGMLTAGQIANDLLGQAVDAFKLALQVYTRDQFSQEWAATQYNLGNVLKILGAMTAGQKGDDLLGQAVDAFKLALQVYTRDQLPQEWAATQNNLDAVLKVLGEPTAAQKGVRNPQ